MTTLERAFLDQFEARVREADPLLLLGLAFALHLDLAARTEQLRSKENAEHSSQEAGRSDWSILCEARRT